MGFDDDHPIRRVVQNDAEVVLDLSLDFQVGVGGHCDDVLKGVDEAFTWSAMIRPPAIR